MSATEAQIMEVRSALLAIEDYAIACGTQLVRNPYVDARWFLLRAEHIDELNARLRRACAAAAAGKEGGK